MMRKSASLLLALIALWAPRVSAQTAGSTGGAAGSSSTTTSTSAPSQDTGTGINVVFNGHPIEEKNRATVPLSRAGCEAGSISVTVSGLPASTTYQYLAVWYGTGLGNCNMGDRASRTSASQDCTRLPLDTQYSHINNRSYYDVEVPVDQVCALDAQGQGQDGTKTLWFLVLQSENSSEDAMFYRSFTFLVDTTPPDPPVINEAGSGMTDIGLKWSLPATAKKFWVIADYSEGALVNSDADAGTVGGTADCSSRYLFADRNIDPSSRPDGLLVRAIPSATTETTFSGTDFHGATKVPVVVVAADLAGNPSLTSDVACLTVTPTTGFWARYKQGETDGGPGSQTGIAEPGCACAAPGAPSGRPKNAWLAAPMALWLAGAFARRRIRRRAR